MTPLLHNALRTLISLCLCVGSCLRWRQEEWSPIRCLAVVPVCFSHKKKKNFVFVYVLLLSFSFTFLLHFRLNTDLSNLNQN